MSDTRRDIASVADRTRSLAVDAPVVAVHFLGETAAFVLGEEALLLAAPNGDQRRVAIHDGGVLDSAADHERVFTAGDDGRVVATGAGGDHEVVASDPKRRWIDHLALGPNGALAWSAGKQAFVRTGNDTVTSHEMPSTVGALAFAPKGLRLAIAHYNGVTLWFPNAKVEPERLEWKGSHLGATFSPDGRFLVTSMQEPTLHAWRLTERKDLRMSGYAARVRSLDWTADGKWLATSGSDQLVLWPFQGKDGPMGKTPAMFAPMDAQVEAVACHPTEDVIAVGYANGMILLVRSRDGAEILARKGGGAAITALGWSSSGRYFGFGTEDGAAGILDLK